VVQQGETLKAVIVDCAWLNWAPRIICGARLRN